MVRTVWARDTMIRLRATNPIICCRCLCTARSWTMQERLPKTSWGLAPTISRQHACFMVTLRPCSKMSHYRLNRFRGGLFNKLDNFGGIFRLHVVFGFTLHNALLSSAELFYTLISGCDSVIPLNRRPSNWSPETQGIWHPVLDGQLVSVDGQFSRCKTQKSIMYRGEPCACPLRKMGLRDYRGGPLQSMEMGGFACRMDSYGFRK